MKGLNWRVDQTDVYGNVRGCSAIFEAKISEDIKFCINYRVYMNNADEWCMGIIQTAPNPHARCTSKKCYTMDVGKKMAEDSLMEIYQGMKRLVESLEIG